MEVWRVSDGKIFISIIGSGLAGLSAAIALARQDISCRLISLLPSERAQSVLAEGGINGALNTMGEEDTPEDHYADTMKAGVYIADPEAVRGLTEHAPEILMELKRLGVAFNLQKEQIQQRNFGGQKKKRTAYARSSTGKVLMTALIDEARKYEVTGLIVRYPHHELEDLVIRQGNGADVCTGVIIRDTYTQTILSLEGPVILAFGGMNGMFPGMTTGTVTNSSDAAALVLARGVRFSNLEMIQYHPTTIGIAGKRCLVSEAARGEGGRLFILQDGRPWYFMEEKYPELGNLMPRDVVAREMYFVTHGEVTPGVNVAEADAETVSARKQVYLDMRQLPKETWIKKLPDLRDEIIHYLGIDPSREPIPVEPGIHYFMGGIDVDVKHRTNLYGLFAAGECCSQYHGANRLGGNSTMGAIYGGRVAAQSAAELVREAKWQQYILQNGKNESQNQNQSQSQSQIARDTSAKEEHVLQIRDILLNCMGIVRNQEELEQGLQDLQDLEGSCQAREQNRLLLAQAMVRSALFRKESRGAHYRSDFPETRDCYAGKTVIGVTTEGKLAEVTMR